MCGIVGIISQTPFMSKWAFERLKRLEYRGYDSYGYFDGTSLIKDTGHIKIHERENAVTKAILHTRWATHGGVTKENAHPHQSNDKSITIIHNGILENYEELKERYQKKGHKFLGQTDSEVIAHYFEDKLRSGKSMIESCKDFIKEARGEFAVLILRDEEHKIYALRRDSPLVLGILKDKHILASDIFAFSDETDKAIFFENDEFAEVDDRGYTFYDSKGKKVDKRIQTFKWEQEESEKKEYDHYMIKEIMEEPKVVSRLLVSLDTDQKDNFKKFTDLMRKSKKIIFTACGTSYHASLLGVYYLHKCGFEAQALIGSEFEHFASVDKDTLVVFISQSGETMDLIEALKYAKARGAKIASIVNVPYSTIQRASEISLNIVAGQEICVAATKSFVNQVTLLLRIAQEFGYKINLANLPDKIKSVHAKEDAIRKIAHKICSHKDLYVLGRGLSYPVAREIALKIKEISYVHAEGMMGGELKHGTIALIEDGTPVIGLISGKDHAMLSNLKEVKARGADVIAITNEFDGDIMLDTANDGKFGILAVIAGQILTYHMAKELGLPIDKPRNLAKSVTVK